MDTKAEERDFGLSDLVLRCYGRKIDEDKWYGVCLNLNLAAEASSRQELVQKMGEVIKSYLYAVLDTEDTNSIPDLLTRRAPISDWITYYSIASLLYITHLPTLFKFKQSVPFHLGYGH